MQLTSTTVKTIQFTRPSNYNFAPYLTQWIFKEEESSEIYIQLSEDAGHPKWERMGNLLEIAFFDFLNKPEFLDECVRLYKHRKEDPLIKITEIIKEQQR